MRRDVLTSSRPVVFFPLSKGAPMAKSELSKKAEGVQLPVPPMPATGTRINVGMMRHPDYDGPSMLTSLPMDTEAQRADAFNVVAGESVSISERNGEVLSICDYVLERGIFEFEDADGPELGVRIWLIAPDGTRYYNGSRSVCQCMERILTWFGVGPWDPPMDLVFLKTETRNGRPWWTVERVYNLKKAKSK